MRLHLYDIIPPLRPYIKLICTMECVDDADTHQIRVLPDTCVEIFINYTQTPVAIIGHELHKQSIITSRMSKPVDVQMRKGSGCLAICFHPGMAYSFFQVPMHTLTDTTASLSDIWNGMALEIEDKLAGICDNTARADMVQKYLLRQLVPDKYDPQVAYCLELVHRSGGMLPVSTVIYDLGLSQRHLSRKFQQTVGLSPKEYQRVYRFMQSLQHLKHPGLSLTEVAYKSGYYDQAHFNRDYKAYTGHTPGEVARAQDILY